jgi:hypothetical protein
MTMMGGDALLGDQVVQDGPHTQVRILAGSGSVVDHHERRFGARLVLRGNVDGDRALVVDIVGLDDQRLGVVRIDLAELLAGDAGVEELGVLRVDHELLHLPLGNAFDLFALRRGHVLRPDDEVVVGVERGILTLLQHPEGRGARVVVVAHRLGYRPTGA